jgi:hypothetical protein
MSLTSSGPKISDARIQHENRWQVQLLIGLLFDPEDGGDISPLTFSRIHGVLLQKIDLFVTTVLRT